MPGCSRPPVTSASRTNLWRLAGSSAWASRICLRATSRCSSASRATKTAPRPPWAWGRRMRNRWPSEVAEPTERLEVRSASASGSIAVGPAGSCATTPVRSGSPMAASHEGLDRGSVVGLEVTATDEVVGQGAGLVQRPGLEGGHELTLVNQPDLQREQAKEQVAISGEGGHGEAPGRDAAPDPAGHRAGTWARGDIA